MSAFVYILRCRDGHYYVGSTGGSLEHRISEHNAGVIDGYTKSRRPVRLAFAQEFQRITDAIAAERQLNGWSRAKKEALIGGDLDALPRLARTTPHPSTSSG
jgi:predicted GIY-YIG superfamily endonuclease